MSVILVGRDGSTNASNTNPVPIIQYDSAGNFLFGTPLGAYMVGFQIRQSATSAIGTIVAFIRNTHATRVLYVNKLSQELGFDGVGAATLMKYELAKYTAVTATTGTSVTPIIKRTSQGASPAAEVKVLDTGITLTGGVLQGVLNQTMSGRTTPSATVAPVINREYIDFNLANDSPIELAQNEAIAIRLAATAVVGDTNMVYFSWNER